MKTYLVGGAVRDLILGSVPHDRDYVVVDSTPAEMLAAGYKQVGADFPVFLHPATGAEYALARVERKVGPGYRGFAVVADRTVSLEDDLRRRDLTINAMAIEVDPVTDQVVGDLIDPYDGKGDLQRSLLKHTSDAFGEDPLRVLRVARFAAKLPSFTIAEATHELCMQMLERGDLRTLTQERVWLETYKALDSAEPSRYFNTLWSFDAALQVPGLSFLVYTSDYYTRRVISATRGLEHANDIALAYLLVGQNFNAVPNEAALKGLSTIVCKITQLLRMNWANFEPEPMYERFLKSGAFRGQWEFIKLALTLLDDDIVKQNQLALQRAEAVTAACFPSLDGKLLGDAIKQGRLKALTNG